MTQEVEGSVLRTKFAIHLSMRVVWWLFLILIKPKEKPYRKFQPIDLTVIFLGKYGNTFGFLNSKSIALVMNQLNITVDRGKLSQHGELVELISARFSGRFLVKNYGEKIASSIVLVEFPDKNTQEELEVLCQSLEASGQGVIRCNFRGVDNPRLTNEERAEFKLRQLDSMEGAEFGGVQNSKSSGSWHFSYTGATDLINDGVDFNLSRVKVGVVDSGIYIDHEDLHGLNGISQFTVVGNGERFNAHGTVTVGIINAKIDNSLGIRGLISTDVFFINSLQLDARNIEDEFNSFIKPLSSKGVKVVNLSLVITNEGFDSDIESLADYVDSESYRVHIDRALLLRELLETAPYNEMLFVFSAGNESENSIYTNGRIHYDSKGNLEPLDNVVIVTANDPDDDLHWYSSFGGSVDISAPSGIAAPSCHKNEESFYYTLDSDNSENYGFSKEKKSPGFFSSILPPKSLPCWNNDAQALGTSFAAPMVTAAAALLFEKNYQLTPGDVKVALVEETSKVATHRYDVEGSKTALPNQQVIPILDIKKSYDSIPLKLAVPPKILDFDRSGSSSVEVGEEVEFFLTTSNEDSVELTISGGEVAGEFSQTGGGGGGGQSFGQWVYKHTFSKGGEFVVDIEATNEFGSAADSLVITVQSKSVPTEPNLSGGVFIQKISDGFDLSWNTATGNFSKYELYRSTTNGVRGSLIFSGNSTSFTDFGLNSGTRYYYTASACNSSECEDSDQHTEVYYKAPNLEGGVFVQRVGGGFDLTWNEATGDVTAYKLFRSTIDGAKGAEIYSGLDISYQDTTDLNSGTRYYYTASACNNTACDDSSQDHGDYSTAPTLSGGVFIQDTTGGFDLSWNQASGTVTSYKLYRSTTSGSRGSQIYSGSNRSHTDTGLTSGTRYYYTASACNNLDCDDSNQDFKTYVVSEESPDLSGGVFIQDTNGGFQLSWNEATGSFNNYELYRSTESGVTGSRIYAGASRSFTDTGLTSGIRYYYTASACNSSVCEFSNQDFKTYTAPNNAPTLSGGVFIQDTGGGFDLSWNQASGTVTSYKLYRSTSSGSRGSQIYSGSARSHRDTGLSSGTTYYYTASACNDSGCDDSNQDFKTYTAPDPAPTLNGGVFIQDTTGGFDLTWNQASGSVTRYELYRSTSNGSRGSRIYSGSSRSYRDTSLNSGTRYYYTASACNDSGCDDSNQDFKTYTAPDPAPTLNGGVFIQDTTGGFDLSWNQASGTVTRYELYRSTSSGSRGSKIYSGSSRSYRDTSLNSGTRYYYTASACNNSGCDDSNQDFKTYTAPEPAPSLSGGVFIQDTTGGFDLSWNQASGSVTRYELYRSTNNGSRGSRIYSGSSRSYRDTSLNSGTRYYYTASACNNSGCDDSNQDFKTYTVEPAPSLSGGVFIQDTAGGFDLSWREASGSVTSYRLYRSTQSGSRGSRIYSGSSVSAP